MCILGSYKILHNVIIQIYILFLNKIFKSITRILMSSIKKFFYKWLGVEVGFICGMKESEEMPR